MDEIKSLLVPSQLKTELLQQKPVFMDYDERTDIFRIFFDNPNQWNVVHYLDDYVGVLFSPESMNIIGIQVEFFNGTFVNRHQTIRKSWKLSENCKEHQLQNVGDMMIVARKMQEPIAKEITSITEKLLFNPGRRTTPVFAQ